ncbi:MAG: homocysteine biosynthesis protein [Promethearchaeota archaeon]
MNVKKRKEIGRYNITKTIEEINEKIRDGSVCVVTAEEMIRVVEEKGVKIAADEIDVVTTGTFGAMCSSGAFLNFGHSDPPIKMDHIWLNEVHAYHGGAAVDCYIGATRIMDKINQDYSYGGGHVIEDLVAGRAIHMKATANGTDCYPRTNLETDFTINDLNQAILLNPRNGYQRYVCAVNSSDRTIYTYMGKLLPNLGNATFSGAGELSPLQNDPNYETIGIGTRIFLGGGIGYVIGEGTQHDPKNRFGTLFLKGDMKQMSDEFLKGASFINYGTTLYVGFGIPIPILNENIAENCAISNDKIITQVVDYGVPRRDRPTLREITYKELYSRNGKIEINGDSVKVSTLSSLNKAREIAGILKERIKKGKFLLTKNVEKLPTDTEFKPMKVTSEIIFVKSLIKSPITCFEEDNITHVANLVLKHNTNHIVVVDSDNRLKGFLTTFDISKAVAKGINRVKEIMIKRVHTTTPDEPIEIAGRKMTKKSVNSLPVIDKNSRVVGIIKAEDVLSVMRRG